MGFILGSIWISIIAFVLAVVLVRPLFALLYPRYKTPSLREAFVETASWVAVGLGPALIYTIIFQRAVGDRVKALVKSWYPGANIDSEPLYAFGIIYAVVACLWSLKILSSNKRELKNDSAQAKM